ncbi:MAG: YfhO family protein [Oscillospiraceae bacterium]|nr:YfhO family protein [Oscillospiraceae bacterium]
MKLKQTSYRNWLYTALSFLIPFITMTTVLFVNKYAPFGKNTLLYSDMYHQYFPFFKEFRRVLLSGESLIYNWSVGLGLDYLGLISYYLASPLYLLGVLVPDAAVLDYFSMLMPIKLGLAGMFFGIFLQRIFNKRDLSIPVFSAFYATCAWALGYQWNIMWLDTFALLPLVMLGMVSLLRDKKFILYTVTLFLSIGINYYIGFFTCIFVLLTFFCYEICRCESGERFLRDFVRIAVFSVIAIGMTAFLTLPALSALQTTQSSVNSFPTEFRLNMDNYWNPTIWGLLDSMSQVAGNMNGGYEPTYKEGLPNVYCGVFATVLGVLYLFNSQIRKRDKVCAAGLLLFINMSFAIRWLDYIWHGFHFTNMIPYRFSFLYSFVLLYMAYSAWVNRKHFRAWHIALAAVSAIAIMFCYKDIKAEGFLAYNLGLLALYMLVLVFQHKSNKPIPSGTKNTAAAQSKQNTLKSIGTLAFLCIMLGEMVLNVVTFSTTFPSTNNPQMPVGPNDASDIIDYMYEREQDNAFFRTECTKGKTLNDGALYGYHGITAFTSSANVNVTRFMVALGFSGKDTYNRYSYGESSPVSNLFLNLKYMIERDGKVKENPYFHDIYSSGKVHLLENNAYLPLGFLADPQLADVDFDYTGDPFQFQNKLLSAASGIETPVWSIMEDLEIYPPASGPNVTPDPNNKFACSYDNSHNETSSHIVYKFTAQDEGLVCMYIDRSEENDYSFWHSDYKDYLSVSGYSLPIMSSVCAVKPGDEVSVWLNVAEEETGDAKVYAAVLNEEVFREHYEKLAESTLDITHFSNTNIEGTITAKEDGLMYTSIPQNGNWEALVDGRPAEVLTVGNAMVSVMIPQGDHSVQLVYKNKALTLGAAVAIISTLSLVGAAVVLYNPKLMNKFHQKEQ